jgi:hypothetical protein
MHKFSLSTCRVAPSQALMVLTAFKRRQKSVVYTQQYSASHIGGLAGSLQFCIVLLQFDNHPEPGKKGSVSY